MPHDLPMSSSSTVHARGGPPEEVDGPAAPSRLLLAVGSLGLVVGGRLEGRLGPAAVSGASSSSMGRRQMGHVTFFCSSHLEVNQRCRKSGGDWGNTTGLRCG